MPALPSPGAIPLSPRTRERITQTINAAVEANTVQMNGVVESATSIANGLAENLRQVTDVALSESVRNLTLRR